MLSELWNRGTFYSPDEGGGGEGEKDDKPKGKEEEQSDPLDYKTWHDSLSDEAKELVAESDKGLKSALDTERDARKTAEKDLRAVAKDLEDGSAAQKKVLEMADAEAEGNIKADFYEDAHKAGVTNLKLAYHVAKEDDLFDKRGNVNLDKLKEEYPELFGVGKKIKGNIGEGTGSTPTGGKAGMSEYIRAAAGKS